MLGTQTSARPFCQFVQLLSNPVWRIARRVGNTECLSRTATRRPDNRPVSSPTPIQAPTSVIFTEALVVCAPFLAHTRRVLRWPTTKAALRASHHLDWHNKHVRTLFCQLVGYPGRPRGGLTIVPSRHFSNSDDPSPMGRGLCKNLLAPAPKRIPSAFESFGGRNATCASFDKSAPPRTLPVVRTAPWPHALWNIEWTATLEYSSEGGSP